MKWQLIILLTLGILMVAADMIDLGDGTFYDNETDSYYYELEPKENKIQSISNSRIAEQHELIMLTVTNKTGIEKYIEVVIDKINDTDYVVTLQLNETVNSLITACKSISCATALKEEYAKDLISVSNTDFFQQIKNISSYPIKSYTQGITINKLKINLSLKESLHIKTKGIEKEEIKIGYDSLTLTTLSTNNTLTISQNSVLLDSTGNATIVYADSTLADLLYCNNSRPDGSFACQTIQSTGSILRYSAAFNSSNGLHIIFANNSVMRHDSTSNYITWQNDVISTAYIPSTEKYSLAIDTNNVPHALFLDSALDIVYCNKSSNAWKCIEPLNEYSSSDTDMLITSNNVKHIAFSNYTDGSVQWTIYCNSSIGTSWNCIKVTKGSITSPIVFMSHDKNDKLYIYSYNDTNSEICTSIPPYGTWNCYNLSNSFYSFDGAEYDGYEKFYTIADNAVNASVVYYDQTYWYNYSFKTTISTTNIETVTDLAIRKGRLADSTAYNTNRSIIYISGGDLYYITENEIGQPLFPYNATGIFNLTYFNTTDGTIRQNITLGNGSWTSPVIKRNLTTDMNMLNVTLNSYSWSGYEVQGSVRTSNTNITLTFDGISYWNLTQSAGIVTNWTFTNDSLMVYKGTQYDISNGILHIDGSAESATQHLLGINMNTSPMVDINRNYTTFLIKTKMMMNGTLNFAASEGNRIGLMAHGSTSGNSWGFLWAGQTRGFALLEEGISWRYTSGNNNITANDWWNLKVFVNGTSVAQKTWKESESEPIGWNESTTSYGTTYIKQVYVGFYCGTVQCYYDNFSICSADESDCHTWTSYAPYQSFSSGLDTKNYSVSNSTSFYQVKLNMFSNTSHQNIVYAINTTEWNYTYSGAGGETVVCQCTSPNAWNVDWIINNSCYCSVQNISYAKNLYIAGSLWINGTLNISCIYGNSTGRIYGNSTGKIYANRTGC